jgi:hypothetical protein
MTNPTKAIWYRVLGYIEYGQVTIIADESEGIEEDHEIMGILKDGYQIKRKVPRMDSDNKRPEWYYPFCMKIIICENSPSDYKAKGLMDRSFKLKTYKGSAQYDVKEIRNPQGNKLRESLLHEIEDLRKLLLAFKLIHSKPFPELDIGIEGRDKELCKPSIQLFYDSESQKEIEETLQYFIDIKNQRKQETLEAVIIPLVINRVSQSGNEMSNRELFELVTNNIDGHIDPNNQNIFYSENFGKIYINTVTKIAKDKLGADRKHGEKSNSILVFDTNTLTKNAKIYGKGNKIYTKPVTDALMHPDAHIDYGKPFYMVEYKEKYDNHEDLLQLSQENRAKNEDITDKGLKHESREGPKCISASGQDYPPKCYYCDEYFEGIGKQAYEKHVTTKHKGRLCYPNKASIEKDNLESQGMDWE